MKVRIQLSQLSPPPCVALSLSAESTVSYLMSEQWGPRRRSECDPSDLSLCHCHHLNLEHDPTCHEFVQSPVQNLTIIGASFPTDMWPRENARKVLSATKLSRYSSICSMLHRSVLIHFWRILCSMRWSHCVSHWSHGSKKMICISWC